MHFLMMSQSEPQEAKSIFCCTMMSFSWERTSRTYMAPKRNHFNDIFLLFGFVLVFNFIIVSQLDFSAWTQPGGVTTSGSDPGIQRMKERKLNIKDKIRIKTPESSVRFRNIGWTLNTWWTPHDWHLTSFVCNINNNVRHSFKLEVKHIYSQVKRICLLQ